MITKKRCLRCNWREMSITPFTNNCCMFKKFIFVSGLLLVVSCEKNEDRGVADLDILFAKQKTITLETEGYLSVRFMEVNERGELLVTGRRDEVILFSETGEQIRNLGESAQENYPGLNWSPNRAVFLQDGSIFVQNNAPWGIFFDRKGHYEKIAPSEFHVSNRFTADTDHIFYSMEITPAGTYIRQLNEDGDEMWRFDDVPERFINLMQRFRVGNQFVADDRFLFFTMVAEPDLFRLDLEEGELSRFKNPPSYVNRAREDISSLQQVGAAGMAAEISEFSDEYTSTYSLHWLTDSLLLIQYQNRWEVVDGNAGFGLQIVTTDGSFPMEADLLTDEWMVTAGNGMIYTMERSDDAYASPMFNAYRLKDSFIERIEAE